ncbi:MAG: NADH-quinone oxidoreductase subunit NuoE [Rhodobacteraceae bacterium]|nr:NADH-quinone oxidoreductase subunit NuoE [Paracoccaceae bacterium]
MLRRLHPIQPEAFVFSNKNKAWAKEQIKKFPKGREASAIIPLLWRAQEQEGWLSRPAIEYVADFLGMNYIRALEVATFYFMYHLKPVGSIAHVQVCGTTSCMICGSENLMDICKELISVEQNTLSEDGKFSWEEVECLGACSNAPMIQIGKDYYEDLNAESFKNIIETFRSGKIPRAGSQTGRYSSEPLKGLTSLKDYESDKNQFNASVQLADSFGDTVKRINPNKIKNAAVVKE